MRPGLTAGVGFSSLIQIGSGPMILFDAGADGPSLFRNMKELGIDPRQIEIVVISHAHGDHFGGLWDILKVNNEAKIYVPASFGASMHRRKLITVTEPVQITKEVFSTGQLRGMEQSLALKTKKGIVVLVGCSHPGVGKIMDVAAQFGAVYGIIGGLHDFQDFDRFRGLSLICPCHCTRHDSEIRQLFPQQCVACGVGLELEI